jgi:transposase InsO family protein
MSETIRNRLPTCSIVGQAQTGRSTLFYPLAWACFWAFFPGWVFTLHQRGTTLSMSRTAKCYDNAIRENFFAILKPMRFPPLVSHAAERLAIFEFTGVWYNRQRLRIRSALD